MCARFICFLFALAFPTLATRFVLKLTDFGLHELRQKSEVDGGSYEQLKARLWTAPELLRQQVLSFQFAASNLVSYLLIKGSI